MGRRVRHALERDEPWAQQRGTNKWAVFWPESGRSDAAANYADAVRRAKGGTGRNPAGAKLTKAEKKEKARKAAVRRRVAVALAKFLKQTNPGKSFTHASIQRLKGGVLKITPVAAAKRR